MRFGAHAYTLDAVIEAGIAPAVARTLIAGGPRVAPERARLSIHGRAYEAATLDVSDVYAEALITRGDASKDRPE